MGVLLAMLLAALDQVVVATALPTIAESLRDVDNMSWVITANLLFRHRGDTALRQTVRHPWPAHDDVHARSASTRRARSPPRWRRPCWR